MTDTALPQALNRGERLAALSDLHALTDVEKRDGWTAELVEGSQWPHDPAVFVFRREAHLPTLSGGNLGRWAAGRFDYSKPMQIEVRVTVPARPFTPREKGATDGS